jgi:hypothetical protein
MILRKLTIVTIVTFWITRKARGTPNRSSGWSGQASFRESILKSLMIEGGWAGLQGQALSTERVLPRCPFIISCHAANWTRLSVCCMLVPKLLSKKKFGTPASFLSSLFPWMFQFKDSATHRQGRVNIEEAWALSGGQVSNAYLQVRLDVCRQNASPKCCRRRYLKPPAVHRVALMRPVHNQVLQGEV